MSTFERLPTLIRQLTQEHLVTVAESVNHLIGIFEMRRCLEEFSLDFPAPLGLTITGTRGIHKDKTYPVTKIQITAAGPIIWADIEGSSRQVVGTINVGETGE